MRIYRFWLDKLNPALTELLIADPQISKYHFADEFNSQFYHGDWQDVGLMTGLIRSAYYGDDLPDPTVVEVPDTWPYIDWLLLQVTLKDK